MGNYNEYILKSSVDNNGNIYDSQKFRKSALTKGGYGKLYKRNYLEVQELSVFSTTDLKVWNYCIDKTRSDFSVDLNITKLAKKLGVSRQKIHQFIKRAVFNEFMKKNEGSYFMNPFIYIPNGISDVDGRNAQENWEKI